MIAPRLSIARCLSVVAIIALNCGLLRPIIDGDDNSAILGALGILLMANVLTVGFFHLLFRRHGRRPFLIGFEIAGLAIVLAYLLCIVWLPDRTLPLLYLLVEPVQDCLVNNLPYRFLQALEERAISARLIISIIAIPTVAVPIAVPQLVVAFGGGILARWLARSSNARTA